METLLERLKFLGCHNHTDGSNLRLKDSITKVEKLVDTAIECGHSGVCLTDHETVSLHIRISQYVSKLKKEKNKLIELESKYSGNELRNEIAKAKFSNFTLIEKMDVDFKLGLGNEIYLVDSMEEVRDNYTSKVTKFPHFILIAKDKIGHEQIRELSSEAWMNSFHTGQMERVPTTKVSLERVVSENKGHLIASTACVGGEFMIKVDSLLSAEGENEILQAKQEISNFVKWCLSLFGDDFYIEIQPSNHEWNNKLNNMAIVIAKAYKIKHIITTDAHYPTKKYASIHESYLNSKDGDREVAEFYSTTYLMTIEEMWEYFSSNEEPLSVEDFSQAMDNTIEIGNKIDEIDFYSPVAIPKIPIGSFEISHMFEDWYEKAPYIEKFAYSEYDQDLWFLHLIEQGFLRKDEELNETNVMRINMELEELWEISVTLKDRMSSYYNLVEYIVDLIWDDKKGNSFVGVARGSVTGFYTCYLVDITQMNPIEWGLPHWRHINKERPDLPDVDLDSEASKRQGIFKTLKEELGFDNVLNITTFKTEGSKSTTLTACRGLGINSDDAQFMASLIPFERGSNWSLSDCFYGNEELEREPCTQLINEVNNYSELNLKDIMLAIEGIIVGRSIHASGVYVFKDGFIKQNALMKAPNGSYTTQWNMNDSDFAGALKVDFLTIEALDKIRTDLELLLKYSKIKWQGTWRDTYNEYIYPSKLDYKTPEMWKLIGENKVDSLFQFVTEIGLSTARQIKPTTLPQLADGNSLMRLMAQNEGESPVHTYIRYKNNIEEWYSDMRECGLNKEENEILKRHLLVENGVSSVQESVMELSMNEKISGFDIVEANKLRKAIAKKKKSLLEEVKALFFSKGKQRKTREVMLSYVWDVQIARQLGYSFSKNHTYPYSAIAVQELNLAYHYSSLFWNCACLTVDSGALESNEDTKDKTTNYGKVASAIGKMHSRGVKIALPHVNRAEFSFVPDEENDEIVFGLKGIVGIGDEIVNEIIRNKPYTSLLDFHERLCLTKKEVADQNGKITQRSLVPQGSIITLVKAGCFDKIENKTREEVMVDYLVMLFPPRKSMDMRAIDSVMEMGIVPDELSIDIRLSNFRKFLLNKSRFVKIDEKAKSKKWYKLVGNTDAQTEMVLSFFNEHFLPSLTEDKDYIYDENGDICVCVGLDSCGFTKTYKEKTSNIKKWLNSPDCLDRYNKNMFKKKMEESALGSISKWEMDSLSFYYNEHELQGVDFKKYSVSAFDTIRDINEYTAEEVESFDFSKYKGRKYPKYPLTRLCGTVLDKDKNKHTVSLLTVEGVVSIKLYGGAFGAYDKKLSTVYGSGENAKKVTVEEGWFKRGNKLLITGYRRGSQFIPRIYKGSAYQHTICLIENVREDGVLELKTERTKI